MTPRPLALASLLMIAAAIVSEPLAAATPDAEAYAGPSLEAETLSGPLDLPGPAAQLATPKPGPAAADRGLVGLDFDALLDSYATVSHGADGNTTVGRASAELRALLQQEYDAGRI